MDVFDLVNTYFPNTSEKEVVEELLSIRFIEEISGKKLYFGTVFCSTIDLSTMYFYCKPKKGLISEEKSSSYKEQKSWVELMELVGITTIEQLNKRIGNENI